MTENRIYIIFLLLCIVCSIFIQTLPYKELPNESLILSAGFFLSFFGMGILMPYKSKTLEAKYGRKIKKYPIDALIKYFGILLLSSAMIFQVISIKPLSSVLYFKELSFTGTVEDKYISNNHAARMVKIRIDGELRDFPCGFDEYESIKIGATAYKKKGCDKILYEN